MKSDSSKKTIVIVGDEKLVDLLTVRFIEEGYVVFAAFNETSGEELVRSKKPSLLVLNLELAEGGGLKLLEKLHSQNSTHLPVVAIADLQQREHVEKAMSLGVMDFVSNVTFDVDELVSKVNALLGGGKPQADAPAQAENLGNILIVEDDQFILNMLDKKLILSHFKTFRAMDVEHARLVLQNNHVDLILLDVILPQVNGITFLRELKSDNKYKSIPVIITSNLGQDEEIKRGMDAGAVDYLVKAYTMPEDIVSKLKKYLKK